MADAQESQITTESVSRDVAETDPIVLKQSPNRRLVFMPKIVASGDEHVRGVFVYERRGTSEDPWEPVTGEKLTSLRSGEGFKLELRSGEVAALLTGLLARRDLYERYGIQYGKHDYVDRASLPAVVRSLLEADDDDLDEVLGDLTAEQVLRLGRRVDLSQLDALLLAWQENSEGTEEAFWQELLVQHPWVFSQLTASPVVMVAERAYVGGKDIHGRGGGVLDFLVKNELTDNVSLVEIKTPGTELLAGGPYRSSGSHSLSRELSGGIVQVLTYRDEFEKDVGRLRHDSGEDDFRSHNPRCVLIAGQVGGLDKAQRRSFELFRNAVSDVQIWTFDEVEARLKGIRRALEPQTDTKPTAQAEMPRGPEEADPFWDGVLDG